jgi:hypothetical protein
MMITTCWIGVVLILVDGPVEGSIGAAELDQDMSASIAEQAAKIENRMN